MSDVRWLSERELAGWKGLQLMQGRLSGELARRLGEDCALTYPDYEVLVVLTGAPDGRMRANDLGRSVGWQQSRTSHHVARMVTRGLVVKERCESDLRGSYVVVTDLGRRQIADAAPGHVAAVRGLFLDLVSAEELDVIARVAERVLAHLDSPLNLAAGAGAGADADT